MHKVTICVCLALALSSAVLGHGRANAQDFLSQDWLLNPGLSKVYMQTVKAKGIFEIHKFTGIEGGVSKDADASIKIDLTSINSGIDIRDVRMRFLLFETYKFPNAEISAKLDKSRLRELSTATRIEYPLKLTLSMHGVVKEIDTAVWITRLTETTVSVATTRPIIVTAESLGLSDNIAKLIEVIGGTPIAAGATITFDLVFGTGALKPELAAARELLVRQRAESEARNITAEGCETRLSVISEKSAIYFKTGSAELAQESLPLLDSVADIASRCLTIEIDVKGHTDNVGGEASNKRLSERRAATVVEYLGGKRVSTQRIRSAGYGDTRPVAPNNSEENRAKNRRIEFSVTKR